MDELLKFFDGDSWTLDYKKETLPTYEHYAHLVNWAVDDSNWPYLPIDLPNADYKSMFKEALQVKDLLVEHRDSESHKGWSSVCVHGEAYNRTRAWNDYEDNQGKTEKDIKYGYCKEVVDRCPIIYNFISSLPFTNLARVRIMYLEAGGYILPHNDRSWNKLNPLNIGLNQPEGCIFRMKDKGDVPFPVNGGACLVDISNVHSVWNNSSTPRVHIIVHGTQLEPFNKMVYDSIKKLCN